jgi:hypothetical protein
MVGMRMPKTSEAVSLFLGSLMGTMKRGEVGAESNRIFVPLDSTRNLKLRLGMRDVLQKRFLGGHGRGLQLTTKQTFALKKAAWDGGQVTDDEARFLLEVGMDARNFESTADGELTREGKLARFDLLRFAHANLADIDPAVLKTVGAGKEASAARAANAEVMMEWRDGAFAQFARSGEASEAEVQAARKQAGNVRATASVAALPVKSSAQQIMAAFLRQSEEIGGWNWLEWVPEDEPHPMLIKPGINWGINGYPSVTSWEACYGAALGTLEKAAAKNKNVPVTIADESGIENKDFGRTTMDNMEDTNILGAGIFAGIENHYRKQGLSNAEAHQHALNHVHRAMIERERTYRDDTKREIPASPKIEDLVPLINRHDADLIALAKEGGVEVLPLDEGPTVILKPVVARRGMKLKENEIPVTRQQYDSMKHFKDGIRVNAHLLKFKKMINLPKPPGRHGIMSNCGLTGANKNHIGLLAGVDRGVVLHNKFARVPKPRDGEDYGTFTERIEQAVRWMGTGAVNLKGLEDEGRLTEEKMNGFDWEAHYDDMVDTGEQWIHHLSSEAQALADEGKGQQAGGPGQGFFDKLGELELFFKHMTAFTWTDMRQTVSSCGPDFGEQVDVGVSIASDNASVVDAYATAALKQVYDRGRNADGEFTDLPSQFEELAKLGDVSQMSFLGRLGFFRTKFQARMRKSVSELYESMQGKRFLTRGRPERLKTWVGAMKMGLAPTDMKGVVLKSGGELIDTDYLGDKTPGRL